MEAGSFTYVGLERIGEDNPDGETFLRDLWEEGEREKRPSRAGQR